MELHIKGQICIDLQRQGKEQRGDGTVKRSNGDEWKRTERICFATEENGIASRGDGAGVRSAAWSGNGKAKHWEAKEKQ